MLNVLYLIVGLCITPSEPHTHQFSCLHHTVGKRRSNSCNRYNKCMYMADMNSTEMSQGLVAQAVPRCGQMKIASLNTGNTGRLWFNLRDSDWTSGLRTKPGRAR